MRRVGVQSPNPAIIPGIMSGQTKLTLSKSLNDTLKDAIAQCASDTLADEEGGILLNKDGSFEFIRFANQNAGKDIAKVLWTASQQEFGKKVMRRMKELHGSFHTHPAFEARPSSIDLGRVFQGFSTNYIYSTRDKELRRFVFVKEKSTNNQHYWKEDTIELTP